MSLKKYFKDYKKSKKINKKNKTRKLRKTRRVKKRKKSKKKKINKKIMKGGLKPTRQATQINESDEQVPYSGLELFYRENQGEITDASGDKILLYPPMEFPSSVLHSGDDIFNRYSINYDVTKIEGNQITINTDKRGIIPISEDDTEVISPIGIHRHHEYNPKRIQATIGGETFFVKEIKKINNDSSIITLFEEDVNGKTITGRNVIVQRNRKGDFIIYNDNPTTIRYLDNQLQRDYSISDNHLKLGHFSLLKTPEDYTTQIRGRETDDTRSEDTILYAGTITWRHDGKALFYNNDCGRYQPDEEDAVYLAKQNPGFDLDKITATSVETDDNPKKFYRPYDHASGLEGICGDCKKWVIRSNLIFLGTTESGLPLLKCIDCYHRGRELEVRQLKEPTSAPTSHPPPRSCSDPNCNISSNLRYGRLLKPYCYKHFVYNDDGKHDAPCYDCEICREGCVDLCVSNTPKDRAWKLANKA